MKKIVPHFWYDKEAGLAAEFYTTLFEDSKILSSTTLNDTPSGTVEMITINLSGQDFMLLSAGPLFKFTPSISFRIDCSTTEEVDALWAKLSEGGKVLMELDTYPFSERYGWTEDSFGLSWQVMAAADKVITQKIVPTLMFVGDQAGKAEEAINYYIDVFDNSAVSGILRYGEGEEPDKSGTIKHGAFTLGGQEFAAMDSAYRHEFSFNEAISFIVNCDTQEEIDYYWDKLSSVPEAEQCGWLKDKFGVSWQIVPTMMDEMMHDKDPAKLERVTEAFLKMKKFDIAELKKAYEGQ